MRTIYLPIYTLRPYERGIQETFGRYSRFVGPGLGFQIPFIHIIRVRDIREHTMDIHPQAVITKDNVEIMVDGIMWVRPTGDEESISWANDFLARIKAVFPNYHMNENMLTAFERLDLLGLPVVRIYASDGSEQYRLSGDDPNRQFSEKDVENAILGLLAE